MECVMKQQTVRNARKLLDTFDEKPFDGDFVLPEYLPEMAAILSCRLEPVIENRQLGNGRLIVDGHVRVHVMYVDNSRSHLFTYEATQPFTSTFNADGLSDPAISSLNTVVSYVNYRAIGPRRLDVRGAFRVYAVVYDTVSAELPSRSDRKDLCLLRCTAEHSLPAQCTGKVFTINEVLDAGGDTATKVISCRAVASVSECKVLSERAIIKGEIRVHSLYETAGGSEETPEYGTCDHTLLYSQVIDAKGLADELQTDCSVSVLSCDVRAEREEGTGRNVLLANLQLSATLCAWEHTVTPYLADAYSTACPTETMLTDCTGYRYGGCAIRRLPLRQELELPEGIADVVDLWCDCLSVNHSDGIATHRLSVHLLASDESGILSCYERTVDFETPLNVSGDLPQYRLQILECDYRRKDADTLELALVTELLVTDMTSKNFRAVSSVSTDDTHPYTFGNAAVRMIFAESGESVWQISKNCHTDVDTVLCANNLKEDVLTDKQVLLIPLK